MNRRVEQLTGKIWKMIYTKRNPQIETVEETVEENDNSKYQSNDSDGCRTPPEDEEFRILYDSDSTKHQRPHVDNFKQQFATSAIHN